MATASVHLNRYASVGPNAQIRLCFLQPAVVMAARSRTSVVAKAFFWGKKEEETGAAAAPKYQICIDCG